MLVNPCNMKSLSLTSVETSVTHICGMLAIFSLLINIHFRDLFLQQRSLILGEVDIRGRKRLLETKECESGRKLRKIIRQESSGKAKTGDLRDCSSLRRV